MIAEAHLLNKGHASLIGATPQIRLVYAIRLRRMGFAVFSELKNRKKERMWKNAVENNFWGEAGVYDLDDSDDRDWLDRSDLTEAGL